MGKAGREAAGAWSARPLRRTGVQMRESATTATIGRDLLSELSNSVIGWISPERCFIASLMREVALESGDHWLDVGCGRGTLLALGAYQEPGAVLFGLDPDEDALELASRRIRGTATPAELRQGMGHKMPFRDDCFDIVSATLVLQGLRPDRRRATIRECFRVLKPGARLLVADWADDKPSLSSCLRTPIDLLAGIFAGRPTKAGIKEQIMEAGFDPPEELESWWTVGGVVVLLSAYKPLHKRNID